MPSPPTTAKTTAKTPRQTVTANTAKTPYAVGVWRWRLTVAVRREFTANLFWRQLNTNSNKLAKHQKSNSVDATTQRTKRTNQHPHMIRRIAIPVSEVEFREFKIEAITRGTTVPKLAREKLFADAKEAANSASKGASHTLTRVEPLERKLDR